MKFIANTAHKKSGKYSTVLRNAVGKVYPRRCLHSLNDFYLHTIVIVRLEIQLLHTVFHCIPVQPEHCAVSHQHEPFGACLNSVGRASYSMCEPNQETSLEP
jgi:hypothetical protein